MSIIKKFKDFRQKQREKKIARNLKVIKNPKAIREDRLAAIEFFVDQKDGHIAIPALLNRFEYSLEHGINDTKEKEMVMDGILKQKEVALPILVNHLKETTKIAWPIKIIQQLASPENFSGVLCETLDFSDVSFDQDKVDKNYDLLCYLRDFKLKEPLKILHFLSVHDERVRFAAVEALINQDDPEIPKKLEIYLTDDSSENTRLHQSVVVAFLEKGWTLHDPGKLVNKGLGSHFYINENNQLRAR